MLRRKPVETGPNYTTSHQSNQSAQNDFAFNDANYFDQAAPIQEMPKPEEPKQNIGDKVRGIFGSMFD
ncbi:cell division protein FtsA C-terminal domain-containing protein [Streptococcus pluranimalium]|uniref:cell division protein FtsA C-terminal domain-containing protein n=1 Tax=Streptococcus pluranimalium TaxID=82348 RepID=UPI0039FCAFEC